MFSILLKLSQNKFTTKKTVRKFAMGPNNFPGSDFIWVKIRATFTEMIRNSGLLCSSSLFCSVLEKSISPDGHDKCCEDSCKLDMKVIGYVAKLDVITAIHLAFRFRFFTLILLLLAIWTSHASLWKSLWIRGYDGNFGTNSVRNGTFKLRSDRFTFIPRNGACAVITIRSKCWKEENKFNYQLK